MATPTMAQRQATTEPRLGNRNRRILQLVVTYAILILIAVIILMPIAWMLSTSFKPRAYLFMPEIHWIPPVFTWDNYSRLLNNPALPIGRWFANSVIISAVITALVLIVDAMAAYAYARMDFPGRRPLFALLLATLFLPGIMFLIPNFLTVARLGLLNSFWGVIIPALAGVFGVFFMRQFFESIPKELEEAAQIDGANPFQTFLHVALPLAKPALATLGIITFLGAWNDFLWPLLILRERALLTLPPGLRTLQGAYTSEYGQMMAGAAITAIPVLILYILLQRYIVESVATTGLKG
jgi:multiple sugar transport system permease protein